MYHGADQILNFVPNDSNRQSSALAECKKLLQHVNISVVMDIGCGKGESVNFFKNIKPDIGWIGVDVEDSPEVTSRGKNNNNLISYDGVQLPFGNNHFDLVLCKQVLEHTKRPREFLKEVARVLKPAGYFVGSTSHLEAFHSLSCWNYTPYGLKLLLEETSLDILEIKPGIDVFTLLLARFSDRVPLINKVFSRYFTHESPFNRLLGLMARLIGKGHQEINLLKLLFCGHFVFLAQKDKKGD